MFSHVFGHKKIIDRLQQAVAQNRLAHASLFSGIPGIGKTEVAKGLIRFLGCESVFVHWLIPEKQTIRIDDLRAIKPKLYLKTENPKVVVIEPADQMTIACANALLKILEEPPPQTYFILITANPSLLPATIRSRCQRIDFAPFTATEIEQFLKQKGHSQEEANARAAQGQGSIQKALGHDAEQHKKLTETLQSVLENPLPSRILSFCEQVEEEEEQIPQLMEALTQLWNQKITGNQNLKASDHLWHQWRAILDTQKSLKTTANKQLLLEQTLFAITA